MAMDTTDTDWSNLDFTGRFDRSLITDISKTLTNMSGENRAKRRRQKLRAELVREHIENKKQSPNFLKSLSMHLLKKNNGSIRLVI
jgi:hypothetical protein